MVLLEKEHGGKLFVNPSQIIYLEELKIEGVCRIYLTEITADNVSRKIRVKGSITDLAEHIGRFS